MYKRIAVALVAIVGVGVLAFVLSQPKEGSVEWHKREYIAAANGPSVREQIIRATDRLLGKAYTFGISAERIDRMEQHQGALIRLGFLERRDLLITNLAYAVPANNLKFTLSLEAAKALPADRIFFTRISFKATNALTVIAARQDMHIWEALIRKADVPEPGK